MEIKCPACSKISFGAAVCPRCECELSLLKDVVQAAQSWAGEARKHLYRKDYTAALQHAGHSWSIKKNRPAAQIAFFASLGAGLFEEASFWYLFCQSIERLET